MDLRLDFGNGMQILRVTWNVTILYETDTIQNLADFLNTYNIEIAAIQEI